MNQLLRWRQTLQCEGFCSPAPKGQYLRKCLFFGSAKAPQHIICGGHSALWPTNSHPDPEKICGAEHPSNIAQAIVAGVTTAKLQSNNTGSQIELVVDHDELGRWDFVKGEHRLDGRARAIHEAGRGTHAQHHTIGVFDGRSHTMGLEFLEFHTR